ncbi:MAG: hypothetical protein J0L93_00750 [Deltaproteobacteria bacterium]|nr:hypothetical protein [Deltaproteobacteria bacterium]
MFRGRGNQKILSYILSLGLVLLSLPAPIFADCAQNVRKITKIETPAPKKLRLSHLFEVVPNLKKYWEAPSASAATIGVLNIVASEAVAVGMLLRDFPAALSIPLIGLDYTLNAVLIIPGKFWTNHNIRLMELDKRLPFLRQFLIGLFCSSAFKVVANYQHLGDLSLTRAGAEILAATILNTLWRTPTNTSVDNWVRQADNPLSDVKDRDNVRAAYLMPFNLIGSPMYIFSLMPDQKVIAHLPLLDLNQWHLGMLALGAAGAAFWKFPKLYNPTAKPIARGVHFVKNIFTKKEEAQGP